MTGQIISLNRPWHGAEPLLTKKQLAVHLQVSTRWIELRMRDGLPSSMVGGRRKFKVSEVTGWLREREA